MTNKEPPKEVLRRAEQKAGTAVGRALRLSYADALEYLDHTTGDPAQGFPFTVSVRLSQATKRGGFQALEIWLGHDGNPEHAHVSVQLDPSRVDQCAAHLAALAVAEYRAAREDLIK